LKGLFILTKMFFLEWYRGFIYKKKSQFPRSASVSYVKLLLLFSVLAIIYCFTFHILDKLKILFDILDVNIFKMRVLIEFALEVVIFLQAILTATSIFSGYSKIENQYLRVLPVKTDLIFIPRIIIVITEGFFYLLIIFLPIQLLFLHQLDLTVADQIILFFVPLLIYSIYTIFFILMISIFLILVPIKKQKLFFSAFYVLMLGVVLFLINFIVDFKTGLGLKNVYSWNQLIRDAFPEGLYTQCINMYINGSSLITFAVILILMLFLMIISSKFLDIYFRQKQLAEDTVMQYYNKKIGLHRFQLGNSFGAFIYRDIILLIRGPKNIFKQLVSTIVLLFATFKLFPSLYGSFFVFSIYTIPTSISGIMILHSVGQEGTQINSLMLVITARKMLKTRLTVGILMVLPIALIMVVLLYVLFPAPFLFHVLLFRLFLFIIFTSIAVMFTLAIATLFADFNPKRLFLDRGISIGGEILYWIASGVLTISFYYIDTLITAWQFEAFSIAIGVMLLLILVVYCIFEMGISKLKFNE